MKVRKLAHCGLLIHFSVLNVRFQGLNRNMDMYVTVQTDPLAAD